VLGKIGYIRISPHCRWNSKVLIVPKPELPDEFSMTVDTNYRNSQLVEITGYLPILKVFFNTWNSHQFLPASMRWRGSGNFHLMLSVRRSTLCWQTLGFSLLSVKSKEQQTLLMHFKQGCMNQWTVCYSNDVWFGSTTYWFTQNLLRSIFKTWEVALRDCVSSTSCWAARRASCFALRIIWCGSKISKDEVSSDPAYLKEVRMVNQDVVEDSEDSTGRDEPTWGPRWSPSCVLSPCENERIAPF